MPQSRSAPIIERAPLPIVEVQGSAHMVSYVNSAFCRLLGKTREDLIGKTFADIVHGGEHCVPILDRIYQTGDAATHVHGDDSDSDSSSWLYAMWPALDANEQPVGVIIQLAKTANLRQDTVAVNEALLIAGLRQHEMTEAADRLNAQLRTEIAERKASEVALRESEERFRVAALAVSNLIWTNNAQGMMEGEQPGWAQFTGQTTEEYQGYGWVRAVHPDDAQPTIEAWNVAVAEKRLFEFEHRVRRHDGAWRSCSIRAVPAIGGDGEIREWVGVHNDITERKQAEEALRESAKRLRFMAESMPQKIFTAKPNGDIDYFNRQWLEFTGLSFEQIRDWGWLQFIHPEDVEENIRRWQHSIDTREPFYMEHRFLRIDGEYRWHVSRAVPMLDAEGKTLMWIGSNTEIEEIRQAREKTERASRAKDEFLAALSHELRTPLTPVLMSAAALQHDDRLPQDVRDQLSMMERNIGLEARLIDDLLDLTRIAHGKLLLRTQPCDAHTLIALAIEMVRSDAQGKSQTLEIDLAAERSHLLGDPARLQQVFWNLLKNAVKFTPESGKITVRSCDLDGRFALEVSDSGIGIAADNIRRIFLPFEQAGAISADHRIGGLGLGLSIVKAILDLHGGSIKVESAGLGEGATFRVEVPGILASLATAPGSTSQVSGDASAESRGHRAATAPLSLLLVDDHQSTLEVLERLLTRAGHRVTTAISVASALQLADRDRFDAVISDLGLPDGTGFELMEKLRAAHGLCGIALSGYGMDEDLRRSREAGFAAHLIKPIDFAQLERALEDLMAPVPRQP